MMKRFSFLTTLILCLAMSVMAQTYVGTMDARVIAIGIPECFTNSGRSYVAIITEDGAGTIYDNDFTTVLANFEGFDIIYDIDEKVASYYDWSTTGLPDGYHQWILFTQGLFNLDDSFEYLEQLPTCWNIKTLDGTVLQTINVNDGYSAQGMVLAKMDNMFYLLLGQRQGDISDMLIYRIDQTTGLTKVDAQLPITVFPTMPKRDQQITVQFGEGNNVKEVTVVNSFGQVVKRVPVEDGQREITIPASDLGTGLNVVNTRTEQGQGNCKIIVR